MRKKLDLSWGNPEFLVPYWKDKFVGCDSELPMGYKFGSENRLNSLVRCLHKVIGNAETDGYRIIFGHGATQLLIGLMKVLDYPVYADPPYFMRFPKFADYAGISWGQTQNAYQILTLPNNPDGNSLYKYHNPQHLLDLSYNWPQYTDVQNYKDDVMVFSLAKATGHASTRIGWAIIKDEQLALELEKYVEMSTGGLSLDAQEKAMNVIDSQLHEDDTVFKYGKNVLDRRWEGIKKLNLPFKVLNNQGMFLWCAGECPEELECVKGKEFGVSNDYFRLNLGCNNKTFIEFLKLYGNK